MARMMSSGLPGGALTFANMTPAAQLGLVGVRAARTTTRRRRKAKATKRASSKRAKRASSKRPARLVKGSAAAKRYMASIRRKRRR